MPLAMIAALFFTVALLVTTAYFILGSIPLLAIVLRRKVIPKMDALGAQIQSSYMDAIPGFRRTHVTAIAINIVQLVVIVWSLTAARL